MNLKKLQNKFIERTNSTKMWYFERNYGSIIIRVCERYYNEIIRQYVIDNVLYKNLKNINKKSIQLNFKFHRCFLKIVSAESNSANKFLVLYKSKLRNYRNIKKKKWNLLCNLNYYEQFHIFVLWKLLQLKIKSYLSGKYTKIPFISINSYIFYLKNWSMN